MTIFNREDARTALPQLEKRIAELADALANITIPNIDKGIVALPAAVATNTYADFPVTFSKAFATVPTVVAGLSSMSTGAGSGRLAVSAISVTTEGFTLRLFNGDTSARQPSLTWVAIE